MADAGVRAVQPGETPGVLFQHVRLAGSSDAHLIQGCEFRFEMSGSPANVPSPIYAIGIGTLPGDNPGLASNWDEVLDCTFVNRCTVPDATPGATDPLACIAYAFANTGLRVHGCTFDGGVSGFDYGAIYANVVASDVAFYDNTFSNGADIQLLAAHTGIFSNNTMADGCLVETLTPITPYPLGLVAAEEGGADILHGPNVFVTGDVFWVDITATRASDSNAGTERDLPFRKNVRDI